MSFIERYTKLLSNQSEGGRSFDKDKDKVQMSAASDRSRVIYSSPFRRLQQKAQVFSLESNASVRSRLTHSLEVADVGRRIAQTVAESLYKKDLLLQKLIFPFVTTVETACLMHDIGNPPFGHFGETAIRDWFKSHWKRTVGASFRDEENALQLQSELEASWLKDFFEFDGNPQGLRIVSKLQWNRDEKGQFGLNLSYSQLLAFIKYTRSTQENKGEGLKKKAGYFLSEEPLVKRAKESLGLSKDARFPLAYIMEAADDIAYCISDIEDGVEKGIVSIRSVFKQLHETYEHDFPELDCGERPKSFIPADWREKTDAELQDSFFWFKVKFARFFIERAARLYVDCHDEILVGKRPSLFLKNSVEEKVLSGLKRVARRELFRSPEAENIELAGYQVISGLLDKYDRLLRCSDAQFELLSQPDQVKGKGLDYEWRLFNRLPNKYVKAYHHQLMNKPEAVSPRAFEWFSRAHLIVDYISGMTDRFALETYQLLNGVRV